MVSIMPRLVLLNRVSKTEKQESGGLSKPCVKMLLTFAQSDRERECLRYAIFKSSGLSQKEARRKFGFESMSSRAAKAEGVLKQTQLIRQAIEDLAHNQDTALLSTFGILNEDSSSTESESDDCCNSISTNFDELLPIPPGYLHATLEKSNGLNVLKSLKFSFPIIG